MVAAFLIWSTFTAPTVRALLVLKTGLGLLLNAPARADSAHRAAGISQANLSCVTQTPRWAVVVASAEEFAAVSHSDLAFIADLLITGSIMLKLHMDTASEAGISISPTIYSTDRSILSGAEAGATAPLFTDLRVWTVQVPMTLQDLSTLPLIGNLHMSTARDAGVAIGLSINPTDRSVDVGTDTGFTVVLSTNQTLSAVQILMALLRLLTEPLMNHLNLSAVRFTGVGIALSIDPANRIVEARAEARLLVAMDLTVPLDTLSPTVGGAWLGAVPSSSAFQGLRFTAATDLTTLLIQHKAKLTVKVTEDRCTRLLTGSLMEQLHIDTSSLASVGVGLTILSTDRLIEMDAVAVLVTEDLTAPLNALSPAVGGGRLETFLICSTLLGLTTTADLTALLVQHKAKLTIEVTENRLTGLLSLTETRFADLSCRAIFMALTALIALHTALSPKAYTSTICGMGNRAVLIAPALFRATLYFTPPFNTEPYTAKHGRRWAFPIEVAPFRSREALTDLTTLLIQHKSKLTVELTEDRLTG